MKEELKEFVKNLPKEMIIELYVQKCYDYKNLEIAFLREIERKNEKE